jgi:hypothetical protein
MKTILYTDIIESITKNPSKTIGQRSFPLFQAYLIPFDCFCEFEIPNDDYVELKKYPSLEEYVEVIYKHKLGGSEHWTTPLQLYTEDNRSLYEEASSFILDYNKKFPNPQKEHYSYCFKKNITVELDLKDSIGHIAYRPSMFFNSKSLSCLRAYIDGYFDMKKKLGLNITEFESKLISFIKKFKGQKKGAFNTWDRNFSHRIRFHYNFNSNDINWFIYELEKYTNEKFSFYINNIKITPDWSEYTKWGGLYGSDFENYFGIQLYTKK